MGCSSVGAVCASKASVFPFGGWEFFDYFNAWGCRFFEDELGYSICRENCEWSVTVVLHQNFYLPLKLLSTTPASIERCLSNRLLRGAMRRYMVLGRQTANPVGILAISPGRIVVVIVACTL